MWFQFAISDPISVPISVPILVPINLYCQRIVEFCSSPGRAELGRPGWPVPPHLSGFIRVKMLKFCIIFREIATVD